MSQMEGLNWKLRRELTGTGMIESSSAYDNQEHEFEHPTPLTTHPAPVTRDPFSSTTGRAPPTSAESTSSAVEEVQRTLTPGRQLYPTADASGPESQRADPSSTLSWDLDLTPRNTTSPKTHATHNPQSQSQSWNPEPRHPSIQIQTLLQPRDPSHHQIDDRSVYTPVEARIGGYAPDQWYPQDTQRIPLISDSGMRKSRSARQITTIISIDDIEHSHSRAFSIDARPMIHPLFIEFWHTGALRKDSSPTGKAFLEDGTILVGNVGTCT
ncbi:hypothetical protein K503DRAFT_860829 [Rhizopogon vinicolor AM-OR11-026]|uniref:Uncharacterized protein n=1 Tax=Rhizopogon vinicolor AM-OR11-026 TaxID=1314800 RepID=A0A1B7MF64_9AGAM|nr:hypothetical protein K503DRAFT_860829 [Rhizopogon vinicolor AM-OR11-026]